MKKNTNVVRSKQWIWTFFAATFLLYVVLDTLKGLSDYWLVSGRAVGMPWVVNLFYLVWVLVGVFLGYIIRREKNNK